MKHYILNELSHYLNGFESITNIRRVQNNILCVQFEKKNKIYFDMTKANSLVYKKLTDDKNYKRFNAPFDMMLDKKFNRSKVKKVFLRNDDKILVIQVSKNLSYKQQDIILQLEFTGKYTNAIILDENDVVIEALRHIDQDTSTRVVKVGRTLDELKKPDFVFEKRECENIENVLTGIYEKKEQENIKNIKKQKISQIQKSKKKIQKILSSLEDVGDLKIKAKDLNAEAIQITSELHIAKGYEKKSKIKHSNDLYKRSKKAKAKALNQHIEHLNLSQKLNFYQKLEIIIEDCKTTDSIEFYLPKKDKKHTKTKKENPYQTFLIDEYKIMLGRDERENIFLLQNSKASDFWFHMKDVPSSHLIVSNTKKNIPEHISIECAKILARFCGDGNGTYKIDYTQRRNIKIQTKANVLYNPYNTVVVKI